MPRGSRRQAADEDVEQRVTRRSLRTRAPATPKKEEPEEEEEEVATPSKSASRGGRGKAKKSDDKATPSPSKKGKGRGSRASASPRGRKSKKAADSDEEADSDVEEVKTTTPSKGRKSPRAAKTEETTPSPRRKSSRGASLAASEAIEKQAEKDEDAMEEDDGKDTEKDEDARGKKRKAEDEEPEEKAEASEEKRQKVDEESTDKDEEEEMKEAKEKPEADKEEKKAEEEPAAMVTEEKEPEAESKEDSAASSTEQKAETPVDAEKKEETDQEQSITQEESKPATEVTEPTKEETPSAEEKEIVLNGESEEKIEKQQTEIFHIDMENPAEKVDEVGDERLAYATNAILETAEVSQPTVNGNHTDGISGNGENINAQEKVEKQVQERELKIVKEEDSKSANQNLMVVGTSATLHQNGTLSENEDMKTDVIKASNEISNAEEQTKQTEDATISTSDESVSKDKATNSSEMDPVDRQGDPECLVCDGVNIGKMLDCSICPTRTHLDCLDAISRVQYMLRQVHYDRNAWLCSKCQVPEEAKAEDKEEEPMDADADDTEFVHVSKEDIPAHDSAEVQKSLPPQITQTNQSGSQDQKTLNHDDTINSTSGNATSSLPSNLDNKAASSNDTNDNPLFSRTFVMNPHIDHSTVDKERVFTIASYNILAECHAVKGIREWGQYSWTTEEKLLNSYRHTLFWKELEYLDADIYCLQEVPPKYFYDVLVPAFRAKGFEGELIKRAHPDFDEGEATFYNTKRFTAIKCQGYILHDLSTKGMEGLSEVNKTAATEALINPAVFMLAQLKCNQTDAVLNVANIHVSWEFFKRHDIQCTQVASAIKELVAQAGGADKPHIICGDFNSTPDMPGYQLARDGYLSEDNMNLLQGMNNITMPDGQKTSLINLFWKGFQHTSNTLKSAYETVQGCNSISSCFPHKGECLAVDYVWYSTSSLKVVGVLEIANDKLIEKGIPNDVFPSDHLSVKAKMAFI